METTRNTPVYLRAHARERRGEGSEKKNGEDTEKKKEMKKGKKGKVESSQERG